MIGSGHIRGSKQFREIQNLVARAENAMKEIEEPSTHSKNRLRRTTSRLKQKDATMKVLETARPGSITIVSRFIDDEICVTLRNLRIESSRI
jgi:hypothetical protein